MLSPQMSPLASPPAAYKCWQCRQWSPLLFFVVAGCLLNLWPCAGTFILRGPPAIAGQVADVASPQSLAWRNRPLCDWQAARAVDWSLHPFHWAPRFSLTLGTASIARAGRRNCRFVSPTGSHSVEDDVARKKKKKEYYTTLRRWSPAAHLGRLSEWFAWWHVASVVMCTFTVRFRRALVALPALWRPHSCFLEEEFTCRGALLASTASTPAPDVAYPQVYAFELALLYMDAAFSRLFLS